MGRIRDFWAGYQERRAEKFLSAHTGVALKVLANQPQIGAAALESLWGMEAARKKSGPERETFEYPTLVGTAYGAKTPALRTYAKPAPFNVRNFATYPPARRAI